MNEELFRGSVSFVSYEKKYLVIDYTKNGKTKNINFQFATDHKAHFSANGKPHQFRVGDEVNFEIRLSDRGDRLTADNVQFLYNTAFEKLINKTITHNHFKGYMKLIDDKWFVKEIESYLFFPLKLGLWEQLPKQEEVDFTFINLKNRNNIGAELLKSEFIPEYNTALKLWKNNTTISSPITHISAFGIYVNVSGEKIQAKLPPNSIENPEIGNIVHFKISHLSKSKIAIEKVEE